MQDFALITWIKERKKKAKQQITCVRTEEEKDEEVGEKIESMLKPRSLW